MFCMSNSTAHWHACNNYHNNSPYNMDTHFGRWRSGGAWSCLLLVASLGLSRGQYAPWAHAHFVWLSNEQSNQSSVVEYVNAYFTRNITVGAIDIDR
jgi:hypothetical protein